MNPKIVAFRTRSQLGMRAPRSRSTNITPQNGGVAVHWGGPHQNLGSHARCEQIWRSWQNYHMDSHGWVDIAYTAAFCNHGYALAGRGYGTRTAANGTNAGNQNYYAFVWIGGERDTVTAAAISALEWLVRDARQNGAGSQVRGHRFFTGSACAGPILNGHAGRLHNKNIGSTPPVVKEPEKEDKDMPSKWAERAWTLAKRHGILDGTRPKDPITREELAVVLERLGLIEEGTSVPSWAVSDVERAISDGVINKGTAGRVVRRYDMLVILKRLLDK